MKKSDCSLRHTRHQEIRTNKVQRTFQFAPVDIIVGQKFTLNLEFRDLRPLHLGDPAFILDLAFNRESTVYELARGDGPAKKKLIQTLSLIALS